MTLKDSNSTKSDKFKFSLSISGLLHHYRDGCVKAVGPEYCKEHFWDQMIEDKKLWWMKHLVMQRTAKRIKEVEQIMARAQ